MKIRLLFILGICLLLFSCASNPISGQKSLNFVPNTLLFPLSFKQYSDTISHSKVITGTPECSQVESVGIRLQKAAEKYFIYLGKPDYLKNYQWEIKLIDAKIENAWCMPGGKIVVYSGILPLAKDEGGLATVLGHEISHALANHGAKGTSAGILQQIGGVGIAVLARNKSEETRNVLLNGYSKASTYGGTLPFSRNNESEADKIGLILMTIAGYNPNDAVAFWTRMSARPEKSLTPEFMSTHPSNENRISNLKSLIPEALETAKKVGVISK